MKLESCLFYYIIPCIQLSRPTAAGVEIMSVTKNNHSIGYLQLTDLCLIKVKPQITGRGSDEFSVHTAPDDSNVKQYIHLHLFLLTCSEL